MGLSLRFVETLAVGVLLLTEAEWNDCADPAPMVRLLEGKASSRKWRLLACACARASWSYLADERSRKAIEVAERLADGQATEGEVRQVADAAYEADEDVSVHARPEAPDEAWERMVVATWQASYTIDPEAFTFADCFISHEPNRRPLAFPLQVAVLRDLFGPLLFRQLSVAPSLLSWNGSTIPKLAQAAYDERKLPEGTLDNGRMAILADALEEAGCREPDLIAHCRQQGAHMRGCWAVDFLLGKS